MVRQTQLFELQSEKSTQKLTFYSSLEKLNRACLKCARCPLSQKRQQVVTGRGNTKPDLAVIGEAPGKQEDKAGQPFVGDSGKFLLKMLQAVQLDSNVYFTNVVRCRPPDNRQPSVEEIKACKPYLIDELRLIEPKIIICVGATVVAGLTGKRESITSLRGKWLDWEGTAIMPIFHPAYLLRNPSLQKDSPKWQTWQDLIAVKLKLEKNLA
ncbi:MAG: uracil-DNA glycosylase [Pleurocapsa sp. MO_226.B13]|nr:uracil-DNA glycosylase [Pleurocapsa sp. MO_226.B13]